MYHIYRVFVFWFKAFLRPPINCFDLLRSCRYVFCLAYPLYCVYSDISYLIWEKVLICIRTSGWENALKRWNRWLGHSKLHFSFPSTVRTSLSRPGIFSLSYWYFIICATWLHVHTRVPHACSLVLHVQWWAAVLWLCLLLRMTLMNARICIFDSSWSRTIFLWTIFQEDDDWSTVKELYRRIVVKVSQQLASEDQNHFDGHHLDKVRIGNTKDSLDVVGDTGMY